ncbi:alcohol dehydrogenase [Cystobacter fuscus]|uniref:Alcohol dehydrogenase n=1 Tax=Cystobacter fuscus TaxID=43 RepID=A0A250IWM1_9BACT|nr:hypothetical protein [Cystobacter fuscus]ATB36135.1 alcohol dehydrogenase [Cystobacter fuscus]
MTTTITAAVARAHKAPFTLEPLHLDDLRPNEARVRTPPQRPKGGERETP